MKYSKKDILEFALIDMFCWIDNFENDGSINSLTEKQQKIYWDSIRQIKKTIRKHIRITGGSNE